MTKPRPNFNHEISLWKDNISSVIGMDEVGRGSFAGPVAVGAVVFPTNFQEYSQYTEIEEVNDSKKLSAKKRQFLSQIIKNNARTWSVGIAHADLIDRLGITNAIRIAAKDAVDSIQHQEASIVTQDETKGHTPRCYHLLTDQKLIPEIHKYNNVTEIAGGDSTSLSIAAASIIAKVWRDNYMAHLSKNKQLRIYQWQKNSGYGTLQHRRTIQIYGPSIHHRKTFLGNTLQVK